jgi:uncharacterized protein (UPF0264 family)
MDETVEPQLLVSVRSVDEARAAMAGGCEILDIKEPNRGSLGMADVSTMAEIVRLAGLSASSGHEMPVTAALGELSDWLESRETPALPRELRYVKLGLAGVQVRADWIGDWLSARARFETAAGKRFAWVAVAYAESASCDAPSYAEVIEAAVATNCEVVLFDTFTKDGKTLLDWLSVAELKQAAARIARAELRLALAGGLNAGMLPSLTAVRPEILAIRSAACRGGRRNAEISADAVREFKSAAKRAFASATPACAAATRGR